MESSARKLLCHTSHLKSQLSYCWQQPSCAHRCSIHLQRTLQNHVPKWMPNSSRASVKNFRTRPMFKENILHQHCTQISSIRSKLKRVPSYWIKTASLRTMPYVFKASLVVIPGLCLERSLNGLKDKIQEIALGCAKCDAGQETSPISTSNINVPSVKNKSSNRFIAFLKWTREFLRLNLRALRLFCVFFPLLLCYPLTYLGPRWFDLWLNVLYMAVERSGATFIKLGQWASTRRDLFSKKVCDCFSCLHHRVRPHAWSHTARTLRKAYGKHWQSLLHLKENQEPIGSGCIAQVYKGYISTQFVPSSVMKEMEEEANKVYFGEGIEISILTDDDTSASVEEISDDAVTADDVIPVAIKVLHPQIRETFHRDLKLMKTTAKYLTWIFPNLHWVNLRQCVEEFSIAMDKQLDMRHEYHCLQKFARDFSKCSNIRVPQPIPKFVRHNILVETFEEGISIGQIVKDPEQPTELKEELAKIGMDVLLQMIFVNNFVHADLHPGNLLVQNIDQFSVQKSVVVQIDALDMMVVNLRPVEECPLKLVLLDCGITASLAPEDREKFRGVFTAVVKGEGEAVADLFLYKSAVNKCTNPDLFRKEMAQIVSKGRQNLMSMSTMKLAELMNDVFSVLSRHKIQLESSFATIILAMAMLEGLGRSLDPNLDLLEKARPVLLGI